MRYWHLALVALIGAGIALVGCASSDRPVDVQPGPQVLVAPGVVLTLPLPYSLDQPVEALQLITAHYNRETFVFETRLSITRQRLLAVGTDLLGRRAMSIEWTGGDLRVETAPWVPAALPPRNVLADIMLIHWPLDTLSANISPPGALRQITPGHRVVTFDGRDLISVDQVSGAPGDWSGHWKYRNLAWSYDLDIQSVDAVP